MYSFNAACKATHALIHWQKKEKLLQKNVWDPWSFLTKSLIEFWRDFRCWELFWCWETWRGELLRNSDTLDDWDHWVFARLNFQHGKLFETLGPVFSTYIVIRGIFWHDSKVIFKRRRKCLFKCNWACNCLYPFCLGDNRSYFINGSYGVFLACIKTSLGWVSE